MKEIMVECKEDELIESPKERFVSCTKCGGEQFHITLSRHGYKFECCSVDEEGMCGEVITITMPRSIHPGQCPVCLHEAHEGRRGKAHAVHDSDERKYHAVITDLHEGGDHERSNHGLTYCEAMKFISDWFGENIPRIKQLAHVPQYEVASDVHPFSGKAFYDVWPHWANREPIEDTAYPHKVASEYLGTIWED